MTVSNKFGLICCKFKVKCFNRLFFYSGELNHPPRNKTVELTTRSIVAKPSGRHKNRVEKS